MGFGTVQVLALSHRGNGDGRWCSCSFLMVPSTQPNLAYPMAEVRSGGAGRQAAGLPDAAPPRATPKTVSHNDTLYHISIHRSVTAGRLAWLAAGVVRTQEAAHGSGWPRARCASSGHRPRPFRLAATELRTHTPAPGRRTRTRTCSCHNCMCSLKSRHGWK